MKATEKSFNGLRISGFTMLILQLLLIVAGVCFIVKGLQWSVPVGFVLCVLSVLACPGYVVIQPNNTRVLTFFGKYVGTVFDNGFYWMNPFFTKATVTLRAFNLDVPPIKVNDKVGNPVMIGAIMVWKIKDTYKAMFDISKKLEDFVQIQSDAAIRQVAGMYAYDSNETADKVTLRSDNGEVAQRLEDELNSRLAIAGIEVIEARINYLAYASEIASVMLRRQQADAIIAARERIVEGAVSMVHLALEKLQNDGVVELDEERKAAMVCNLLVVLCADEAAQPIINAGTLHH